MQSARPTGITNSRSNAALARILVSWKITSDGAESDERQAGFRREPVPRYQQSAEATF
ncbi:hypothetical protein [Synechococcus sp. MIT S9503]|uniref:hypothetical protein n=1 Tax=Synechococcus sp. MIT S9503 TaxID=3082547 RepID=UPI0039A64A70